MARKFYNHKYFQIGQHLTAECDTQDTRSGFRHLCILRHNGAIVVNTKACYQNRTWESFDYQTVIQSAIDRAGLTPQLKAAALAWAKKGDGSDMAGLRAIAGIAKLGELLCPNQKEKNDWKARMLKAGLGGRGLEMPEDWDSLTEDEKQRRLDGAIKLLST